MIESSARDLIDEIFTNEFRRDGFIKFTNKLLYSASFHSVTMDGDDIPKIFQEHIHSLECLASYKDSNNKEIDLLIVKLLKDTALDRARTTQRNFIAQYLEAASKNAALVAFVSPDASHWRFSLIKVEAKIIGIEVEKTLTPAKRWSFLVGKNEGCHTVKSQLIDILLDNTRAPSLDELEKAFDIETVSKEFFDKYSDLFFRMKETLDDLVENDQYLKKDFLDKGINTSDFAKKTMGQISFLYFLQKKGWFGVAPGKEWGSGVKNFLREVFNRREKYGKNFFDDVLEPMFYEALAQDRGNEAIYPRLNNTRMPFLNGGLFEPMNNYSWETTHILLPDELFSNESPTKEGDIGDGILDVFDRYNFTVNEADPLDKEIAVDPEMLGKVFENLLDKKERGDKGAFYTPREIVQFMCQESLIEYLSTKISPLISIEDLNFFIKHSSEIFQNDISFLNHNKEKTFLLPQPCIDKANELDVLLQDILVCDPAVGSGAFPIGMLNEIVDARKVLDIHLNNNISTYDLKLHTISKSLYGVDLDPGAIEIAKLRFWLSLVVEEEEPTPLPNLEHKIMQGNSLISQYNGIELFDSDFLDETEILSDQKSKIDDEIKNIQSEMFALQESGELDQASKKELDSKLIKLNKKKNRLDKKYGHISETGDLFDGHELHELAQEKIKLLQAKIARFISLDSRTAKENLKQEIDNLKWDLIELTLQEKDEEESLSKIKQQRRDRVKPFFIWKLEFSEVFSKNNGFDIVIGNPPYLRVQGIEEDISKIYKKLFESATGNYDLYVLFVERGLKLLSKKGVLNYIMPHKWINSSFGKGLRSISSKKLRKLISFEAYQVFNASTYTSLVWFDKSRKSKVYYLGLEKDLNTNNELQQFLNSQSLEDYSTLENETLGPDAWVFTNKKVKKILDKLHQQKLKVKDVFERIFTGLQTSQDSVYFLTDIIEKDNLFECYSKALDKRIQIEKEMVKPLLKGDDVHRYETLNSTKLVLFPYYISFQDGKEKAILYSEDEIKNKFPYAYIYLKNCEDILKDRENGKLRNDDGWYKYIYPKNLTMFNKEKLIQPDISMGGNYAYDLNGDFYCTTTLYGYIKYEHIKESYFFYMAILNSTLMWFYIQQTGTVLANGFFRFMPRYVEKFPLPKISTNNDIKSFEKLVKQIISNKSSNINTSDLESEVNAMVYKLYELTDEDIEFIEANTDF